MTCVVVKATELVGEGVVESVDCPLLVGDVFEDCTGLPEVLEALSALLLFFDARLPRTPPPTAAPMITTIPTTAIIQKVLGVKPQMRRC
jgi:hypothetical protein